MCNKAVHMEPHSLRFVSDHRNVQGDVQQGNEYLTGRSFSYSQTIQESGDVD